MNHLPIDTERSQGAVSAELKRLSEGLLLLSESEAPFEIVALTHLPPCPEDMEEISLEDVLGYPSTVQPWHTKEEKATVARFVAFKQAIESNLHNIHVYKTLQNGLKQVWIIGQSQEGCIGILTTVVET
ncbi:MAG: nuclease A inhibitor family protein [Cytophagales bacterium]|nr:nuclease A inhibitor family protein [Bernardetiaceae bacterium]MDW8209667.1 nuclease A inhibitor family protein [Cytophagales bacterium]